MIAGAVRSGLDMQAVDGVNVSVVFTVKLLSIATVDPHRPNAIHLSHHHPRQYNTINRINHGYVFSLGYVRTIETLKDLLGK